MKLMVKHTLTLMNANHPSNLVNDGEVAELLMKIACTEDPVRDVFYGRCLGFIYGLICSEKETMIALVKRLTFFCTYM